MLRERINRCIRNRLLVFIKVGKLNQVKYMKNGTDQKTVVKKIKDKEIFDEDFLEEKVKNDALKDLIKNNNNCKEALKSENLVILTGAGSSMDGGGKSVEQIWEEIFGEVEFLEEVLGLIANEIEEIKKEEFVKKIKEEDFCKNKNLEELLSRLEIERKARKNRGSECDKICSISKNDPNSCCQICKAIKEINAQIKKLCSKPNSEPKTHKDFLTKILAARKKTSPRAKIFTLNYDTFFEDAASDIKAVVIDGFCFNEKRIFNSTDFDLDIVQRENSRIHKEENFYDKVFHLYKMHGSVTWKLEGREIKKLDKSQIEENKEPLLIYPNASKFEESYQMPFYEMISRFQISLRATNTTLMIIGFNFGDNHINRIIEEAVDSNLSLKVIVVDPNIEEVDEKKAKEASENLKNSLIKYAKNSARITFFGTTFKEFVETLPEVSYQDDKEKPLREDLSKEGGGNGE